MSRVDKQVEKLMKALDITEEEALQVIADDKAIDKGEKLFELTAEQKKASKSARQGDRKPTVYKFDTSKRKRPENVGKRTLIDAIQSALTELGADSMEVTNPERELNFEVDGVKYKVVLSCPRK
jgi:predicted nuclease of restriction endonuclease-like (RecB) superfamily